MSLYAKYIQERTDDLIFETDKGFITYRYLDNNKTVYLIDVYVLPDFRESGEGKAMANAVLMEAKELGCTKVLGSVIPSNKGSTISLRVLLAYGMELDSSSDNFILFKKEL